MIKPAHAAFSSLSKLRSNHYKGAALPEARLEHSEPQRSRVKEPFSSLTLLSEFKRTGSNKAIWGTCEKKGSLEFRLFRVCESTM